MKKPNEKNSGCLLYFHLSQMQFINPESIERKISLDCIAFFVSMLEFPNPSVDWALLLCLTSNSHKKKKEEGEGE